MHVSRAEQNREHREGSTAAPVPVFAQLASVCLAGALFISPPPAWTDEPDSDAVTDAVTDVQTDVQADVPTPPLATLEATDDTADFGYLAQQIDAGEAARAEVDLKSIIAAIESEHHRYHPDLVEPLTLLGDAHVKKGELPEALDQYGRARHIARVSHGLFDSRQVVPVYREADVLRQMGDLKTAGKREEYAYEVMRKDHDEYSPSLLPAIHRLAEFYVQTYNYLAARSLFTRAVAIHEAAGSTGSDEAVLAYRGVARSHRLERFPPFYVAHENDNRNEGPLPGLTTSELRDQHIAFNNFPAGERALQRVVEIRQRQNGPPTHTFDAILELADWHMMFGRTNDANALYTHVYRNMAENGHDATAYFAHPKLIYWPLPYDPKPPPVRQRDTQSKGHVKLGFSVSATGRVRKMKTLESEPDKLMDFRVRRSMRLAVFRPRLQEGAPVTADDQSFTHRFNYFPRLPDPTETEQASRAYK